MKTAMQELRDEITQIFHDSQISLKIDISKYLEKEKEQIKDAWYNGGTNGMGLFETNTGEEYYNKKY
jgi:hypothetical protein